MSKLEKMFWCHVMYEQGEGRGEKNPRERKHQPNYISINEFFIRDAHPDKYTIKRTSLTQYQFNIHT